MTSGVRVVGGSKAAAGRGGRRQKADDRTDPEPGGVALRPEAGADEAGAAAAGDVKAGGKNVDGENVAGGPTRRHAGRATDHADGGEGRTPSTGRHRRAGVAALAVLAVLGVAGTIGFGLAWQGAHATQAGEAQARAKARSFLVDLTNFNAKTVDADFSAVSSMATGAFASQAQRFFNSAIRQDLQKALASSRGQIRALYVQSYGSGSATVYAVADQLYVNAKLTSPQTDVLRLVVGLSQVGGQWKVANVTVLQGPSLQTGSPSTGGGSGSTGGSSSTSPSSTSPSSTSP